MWIPIGDADSFKNGIIFHSKHKPEYVTMITIDEAQNTEIEWLSEEAADMKNKMINAQYEEKANKLTNIVAIFMFTPIFILLATYLADVDHNLKFLRIFDGIIIPVVLISLVVIFILIALISFNLEKKISIDPHRFHSAEHMVINAYENLHRIPLLEELHSYSRFDTKCGTNTLLKVLIPCVASLGYLIFKLDFWLCCIITVALGVCLRLGGLNFVQVLVTEPPTDRELNVAIEGLKAWLENEQKLMEDNSSSDS